MYIITKNKLFDTRLIVEYIVVSKEKMFQTEFKNEFDEVLSQITSAKGYAIKAYSNKHYCNDGLKGGYIINTYSTEAEARTTLDRVLNGLLNGEKVIDLR